MIDKIKALLNITDDTKDIILDIYISRATTSISKYLNNSRITNEMILSNYEDAIIVLVENAYRTKGKTHIKSYTQGKRSETFKDEFGINSNEEVKNLLPRPYVRLM